LLAPCRHTPSGAKASEAAVKQSEEDKARAQQAADDCAQYGPGYQKIAGTETCIRIGGSVAVQFGSAPPSPNPSRSGSKW
jgi:hypothetical protein